MADSRKSNRKGARTSAARKPAKRSRRDASSRTRLFRAGCLRLFVILALIVALAAIGVYLERGNRIADLPHHARELPARLVRESRALVERLVEGLRDLPTGRRPSGETPPPDRGSYAEPIALHFAPGVPDDPNGIEAAFLAFLEQAETSVHAAFYDLDLAGAAEVLVRKHHEGVDVRLVTDSDYGRRKPLQTCIDAGVPVVFDERGALMHNKFCIVDGERVWTGSTNITFNGMRRNNNNALCISAPLLAENYAAEFREMFELRRFGASSPSETPHPELRIDGIWVENYFAPEDDAAQEIIEEIDVADRSIRFMAFVFTSEEIADAMARRIPYGVTVEGIVETRSAGSAHSRDDYLRAAGAVVHLDANPHTMHHKVIVVDGRTVITGSYNFSKSAEERNDENVLIIHSPLIARRFEDEFLRIPR